jgi:hypothetical protein
MTDGTINHVARRGNDVLEACLSVTCASTDNTKFS